MKRCAILVLLALLPRAAPAAVAAGSEAAAAEPGTTVMVDRESDAGLYLTPWQEEHADSIDPPPSLYRPSAQPLQPRSFSRRVRDDASVEAYRRQQLENFR